jgi:hypothetical protein
MITVRSNDSVEALLPSWATQSCGPTSKVAAACPCPYPCRCPLSRIACAGGDGPDDDGGRADSLVSFGEARSVSFGKCATFGAALWISSEGGYLSRISSCTSRPRQSTKRDQVKKRGGVRTRTRTRPRTSTVGTEVSVSSVSSVSPVRHVLQTPGHVSPARHTPHRVLAMTGPRPLLPTPTRTHLNQRELRFGRPRAKPDHRPKLSPRRPGTGVGGRFRPNRLWFPLLQTVPRAWSPRRVGQIAVAAYSSATTRRPIRHAQCSTHLVVPFDPLGEE